jgi:hypothetical protein
LKEKAASHPGQELTGAAGKVQMRREMPEMLEIFSSSSGGQPAGENLTNHPPTLSAQEAQDRLKKDGIVETYNAADDQSEKIKLEEETIECTMDTPVWECMEKHGSYGIRRLCPWLFTQRFDVFLDSSATCILIV